MCTRPKAYLLFPLDNVEGKTHEALGECTDIIHLSRRTKHVIRPKRNVVRAHARLKTPIYAYSIIFTMDLAGIDKACTAMADGAAISFPNYSSLTGLFQPSFAKTTYPPNNSTTPPNNYNFCACWVPRKTLLPIVYFRVPSCPCDSSQMAVAPAHESRSHHTKRRKTSQSTTGPYTPRLNPVNKPI